MKEETEQWIKSFWIRLKALWERETGGGRGEIVSLWMTDKVSAARCFLYQLFPHCVWLSRRWAAQRCPPGLERRRTGRGAWRDKNLISLQPFVASPSILPSQEDDRLILQIHRHEEERELPPFFTVCLMVELYFCFSSHHFLPSRRSAASRRPREGYFLTLDESETGFHLHWNQACTCPSI